MWQKQQKYADQLTIKMSWGIGRIAHFKEKWGFVGGWGGGEWEQACPSEEELGGGGGKLVGFGKNRGVVACKKTKGSQTREIRWTKRAKNQKGGENTKKRYYEPNSWKHRESKTRKERVKVN